MEESIQEYKQSAQGLQNQYYNHYGDQSNRQFFFNPQYYYPNPYYSQINYPFAHQTQHNYNSDMDMTKGPEEGPLDMTRAATSEENIPYIQTPPPTPIETPRLIYTPPILNVELKTDVELGDRSMKTSPKSNEFASPQHKVSSFQNIIYIA